MMTDTSDKCPKCGGEVNTIIDAFKQFYCGSTQDRGEEVCHSMACVAISEIQAKLAETEAKLRRCATALSQVAYVRLCRESGLPEVAIDKLWSFYEEPIMTALKENQEIINAGEKGD